MKRLTKIFLLSALILCITGIVFSVIGLAVGGTSVLKEGGRITANHLHWSNFDLLDCVPNISSDIEVIPNGIDSLTLSPSEVKAIDIDASTIRLKIITDKDTNQITFHSTAKKASRNMGFTLDEDGTVKIRPIKLFKQLSLGKAPSVTITCPEDFNLSDLHIDIANGSVTLDGKMTVDNFFLDQAAGNCTSSNVDYNNLSVDNAAGNVTLLLPGVKDDYNFDLECAIGHLSVGGESFNGFGNDYEHNGSAHKSIHIDDAVGNVQISFAE